MSTSFSCPLISASEIVIALAQAGITSISEKDLASPTPDLVRALYSSIIKHLQPSDDYELDFGALQLLDNPELHEDAISDIVLKFRMKGFLESLRFNGFKLNNILSPDSRHLSLILSAVTNFVYYRDEKLASLQVFMDKVPTCIEEKSEYAKKIEELKMQIMNFEAEQNKEEPMIHEVDTEVNKLKQSIQDYNKQQMFIRNQANEFQDKINAAACRLSQADFELLKKANENSKLLSEVVQSPDKLQRLLEEKRKKLDEVKDSVRVATQSVQEKNVTLEVYAKASKKFAKLSSQIQAIQEHIDSAKNLDKDLKVLKAKSGNDTITNLALEAKMLELQGKEKQNEELLKAAEVERQTSYTENIQKVYNERAKMEHLLKNLELRERKLEDMVSKSESLCQEVDSIKEAENTKQLNLLSKLEEVLHAFHSYSNRTGSFLDIFENRASYATSSDIEVVDEQSSSRWRR